MFELDGQTALVTGASRGIGRKISELLAGAGAEVILADLTLESLAPVVREIEAQGGKARGVELNVTDSAGVKARLSVLMKELERLEILVNNAGIVRDNLLIRMSDQEWRDVLATNLDGVYYVTREVIAKMMRQRYGRVINIASVVGQMGNPGQVNYVASKAGLIGMTKALAREVASRNITVNAIAPGYIQTAMTEKLGENARAELLKLVPLGRIGTSDDIACGALFLASAQAGYITGHVLNINGGMYM